MEGNAQWAEIHNPTVKHVRLCGCDLGDGERFHPLGGFPTGDDFCWGGPELASGAYWLIGSEPAAEAGYPLDQVWNGDLDLRRGQVGIACAEILLDAQPVPAESTDGPVRQLDLRYVDSGDGSDPATWCGQPSGTPGLPNTFCPESRL